MSTLLLGGNPIAQLILEKVSLPILKRVKDFHPLLGEIKAVALEMSVYIYIPIDLVKLLENTLNGM